MCKQWQGEQRRQQDCAQGYRDRIREPEQAHCRRVFPRPRPIDRRKKTQISARSALAISRSFMITRFRFFPQKGTPTECCRYRVAPAIAKGLTSQKSVDGKPTTPDAAETRDRNSRVFRATRVKTAASPQQRADEALVECKQGKNQSRHNDDRVERSALEREREHRRARTQTAVAGGGYLGYNTPPPSHKVRTEMAKIESENQSWHQVGKGSSAFKARSKSQSKTRTRRRKPSQRP